MLDLRKRIIEFVGERRRFGYQQLHILLRRKSWQVIHKTVQRIYRGEGLQVCKCKKNRMIPGKQPPLASRVARTGQQTLVLASCRMCCPAAPCSASSLSSPTSAGNARPMRLIRRCWHTRRQGSEASHSDARVAKGHRCRHRTRTSKQEALDEWAYRNNVRLHFIEPCKRTFGNIVQCRCVCNVARDKFRIAVSPGMSYPV